MNEDRRKTYPFLLHRKNFRLRLVMSVIIYNINLIKIDIHKEKRYMLQLVFKIC